MEKNASAPARKITFRLHRYDPEKDAGPRRETREVAVFEGMTVLEALHLIKSEQDPTLAWRSSCRMGICGSCGMYINGRPRLACQTQVLHLEADIVEVAPLPNYPTVKDLVPDLMPLFEKHASIHPHLIPANGGAPFGSEYLQTPEEREAYGQFSICIKCGLCMAACPTLATDSAFLGPQPLAQAFRYTTDCRDAGLAPRLAALDALHGPFQCHLAGACTDACPKGVDPALAIQLLKRALSLEALGLLGRKRPPAVAPLPTEYVPNDKIPKAPERTAAPQPGPAD
ncbi:MAG: succinate dehydrogenase iron-sulfur subunit [Ardenticatenaceae bacterium]|nr:succinate dehydrogenase iron-sulfur subunit [Ardenticatenaceae bacterium]